MKISFTTGRGEEVMAEAASGAGHHRHLAIEAKPLEDHETLRGQLDRTKAGIF